MRVLQMEPGQLGRQSFQPPWTIFPGNRLVTAHQNPKLNPTKRN